VSIQSKAKAAKKRERLKEQQERERLSVEANANRLRAITTGFARTTRTKEQVAAYEASKFPQYVKGKTVEHSEDPDRFTMAPYKRKTPFELDEEMLRREQRAKEHYEANMKPRIAPAFNKGGDQYLTESELEAQRHGELRRRS
jgi:hypothetical protein